MVALAELVPGGRQAKDPNLTREAAGLGWRTISPQPYDPGRYKFQRGPVSVSIHGERYPQHTTAGEVAIAASNGQARATLVLRETGFTLVVDSDASLQDFPVSHSRDPNGRGASYGIGGLFSVSMNDAFTDNSVDERTVFESPTGVLRVESALDDVYVLRIDYCSNDPQFQVQEGDVRVGGQNGAAFYDREGDIYVIPESSVV